MKNLVPLLFMVILLSVSCAHLDSGTKITITGAVIAILAAAGYLLLRRKK